MKAKRLCLLDRTDDDLPLGGSQQVCQLSIVPELAKRIEAAGTAFEFLYNLIVHGKGHPESESSDEETKEGEEKGPNLSDWEKKRKVHHPRPVDEENLYAILGLGELGMGASDKDIRTAYRKMALIYHPDKQQTSVTDPIWLKIQNAYETLIDPEKKKKYDSSLDFDDTIPTGPVDPSKFFEVFAPVFRRNAHWSNKRPVPDLGNMDTPMKEVEKFYDFWFAFDSWRDFSHLDEYNLDEAENRYERRYMEKENKKKKAQELKKEKQRIFSLAELAQASDPRILAKRREEEEARARIKAEKQAKKDKQKAEIEERIRKEEEEKLAKEREEAERKAREEEARKKEAERQRNLRKEFIRLLEERVKSREFDKFWGQEYVKRISPEEIAALNEILQAAAKDEETVGILRDGVGRLEKKKEEEKKAEKGKDAQKKVESTMAKWNEEEVAKFYKAVSKFPVGTKNRWDCIATYIGTRTANEVIEKAKELSNNSSMRGLEKQPPQQQPAQAQTQARPEPKVEEAKNGAEPNQSDWSQEQQAALEAALRKFPNTIEAKERWGKIAECVPGKTMKECVDRFKELRAMVKNAGGNAK
eukprot:TRINITY_DN1860_c0_g1_i2.p1 TRINITY_DN1860_c0_g1~~TRINITY_DN1860_c0_g1_i2.p1  ORF type:complete len:587 (+),score=238.11 TRINITY_DN1860_c0_g1_i2:141-1901(+)